MQEESSIKNKLFRWSNSKLRKLNKREAETIVELREEASSRKYYRLLVDGGSFIGVFSPPEKEPIKRFLDINKIFINQGISVPKILGFDAKKGFMLVEDFGDSVFQYQLNSENASSLYTIAFNELILIQSIANQKIPSISKEEAFRQMSLFEEWFLITLLDIKISGSLKKLITKSYNLILEDFFSQPQVICHFDFESRNLMVLKNGKAGVLDFQDAVKGPIFLDPAALIKDLYQDWSEEQIDMLLGIYLSKAQESGLVSLSDELKLQRWFDLAGLQRQLRILGTLSRLYLRDKKSFRLPDLEKTLLLCIRSSSKYKDLSQLANFLDSLLPELNNRLNNIL